MHKCAGGCTNVQSRNQLFWHAEQMLAARRPKVNEHLVLAALCLIGIALAFVSSAKTH